MAKKDFGIVDNALGQVASHQHRAGSMPRSLQALEQVFGDATVRWNGLVKEHVNGAAKPFVDGNIENIVQVRDLSTAREKNLVADHAPDAPRPDVNSVRRPTPPGNGPSI